MSIHLLRTKRRCRTHRDDLGCLPEGITAGGLRSSARRDRVPAMRLGIDFGTTHTVVAACDRGNYPSSRSRFRRRRHELSRVVAERGGELRFGHEALEVAADPSWTVVRSFKRLLGEGAPPDAPCASARPSPGRRAVSRFLDALRARSWSGPTCHERGGAGARRTRRSSRWWQRRRTRSARSGY